MKQHLSALLKKKENIGGLFWQSLFSYASVLLLPILICSIYYVHSYHTVKERTFDNQHLILQNSGEQVDSVFRDTINLSSHLQLDQYVIALSNRKATPESSPYMDRYYLQKELRTLQISNAMLQQISIYFPGTGYIVSTTSTHDIQLLPFIEEKSNTLSADDWNAVFAALQNDRIICYSAPEKNFIAVAQTLLTDADGFPLSVLCVQIEKNSLSGRLSGRQLLEYPCTFALICESSALFTDGGLDDDFSELSCAEIFSAFSASDKSSFPSSGRNGFYEVQGSRKLIVDFYQTLLPGTALVFVAEKASFQSQLTGLLVVLLLTIVVCILLGFIVITWFSRRNYEPVSRIVHFLNQNDGSEKVSHNEYQYIMDRLIEKQDEMEKQRELLKNNYLQKIFTGEIAVSQISEQVAAQFDLDLSPNPVCVVSLMVDDADASEEMPSLTTFTIKNVYQELLSAHFPDSSFSTQKQRISVLISVPEALAEPVSCVKQATEKLIAFLSSSFQLNLKAGISDIHPCDRIPDAWLQADTALEYLRLFEMGQLCLYPSIPQKQIIGSIPLHTSEYVINLVTQGQRSQITEYFGDIKKELARCELSLTDIKSCYYFFYQATAKLSLYCQSRYGLPLHSLEFLSEEFFAQPLPSALSQTCDAYLAACDELTQKNRELTQDSWGSHVCRFIENNYFDSNINLNTVAAHFHISPSYLSMKFREQYQKSVIDYLYEIRIENSLPLLAETDLKVSDIAQMTGFVDSNAFIRIFKKLKGVTPGKYREMKRV